VTDLLDGSAAGSSAPEGRTLVETGEPVAGSMSRSAAALLFEPGASRVTVDPRLAGCLRRVASDAALLPVPRERVRAGAALAFAVELTVTRASQGRPVRSDGFLIPDVGGRAPADELAEAAVLAARLTPEEWRVRHLGYLLAEAAVSPDLQRRDLLDPPPAVPRPGGAALPRLRMADLRLTRRGVLVHRLLALDFVRDDAVTSALAALDLPRS
jgi:hypothetical protein